MDAQAVTNRQHGGSSPRQSGRSGRCGLWAATVLLTVLAAAPGEAGAFWFFNKLGDSAKAANAAAAARQKYHDLLVDPSADEAQIQAAKLAWDTLRNATFDEIHQFANSVPNTSLTGPSNIKDLARKFIKEAIKEGLGEISGNPNEGLPSVTASRAFPEGRFEGTSVFDSIPVGLTVDHLNITAMGFLRTSDYDGSLGPAPEGFYDMPPLAVMRGTFDGVPVDSYLIDALSPDAGAFGGALYTLAKLESDLGTYRMGLRGFGAGFFDEEIVAALALENPAAAGIPIEMQISFIVISAVDVSSGTISGVFFSATGPVEIPEPGIAALLCLGAAAGISRRRNQAR